MKKLFYIICCSLLSFVLVGCGNNSRGNIIDHSSNNPDTNVSQEFIRSITVTIEDRHPGDVKGNLISKVKELDGYTENMGINDGIYTVTVRVPTNSVDKFMDSVNEYTIKEMEDNTDNITSEYTDVESRIATKRAAYERYKKLLENAKDSNEVRSIQEKMDSITEDIEAYEQQKKEYDSQINYSTISLTIQKPLSGAAHAFDDLGETAITAVAFLIRAIIWVIPFIIVIGIFVFSIIKIINFAKNRHKKGPNGKTLN